MTITDPLAPPAGLGEQLRGHANPRWAGEAVVTVCASVHVVTGGHCAAATYITVWLACINEHLGPSGWCPVHYQVLRQNAHLLVCGIEGCGQHLVTLKTEKQ